MIIEDKDLDAVVLEAAKAVKAEVLQRASKITKFPAYNYYSTTKQESVQQAPGIFLYYLQYDEQYDDRFVMLTSQGIWLFRSGMICKGSNCWGKRPILSTGTEHHYIYLVYGNQALQSLNKILEQQEHNP